MLVVAGVLTFALLSGIATMALSLQGRDVLMLSDSDYQVWKDEMRATTPVSRPAPASSDDEHD